MGTSATRGFVCCTRQRDRHGSIKLRGEESVNDTSGGGRVMGPAVAQGILPRTSKETGARDAAMKHERGPLAPDTREITEASTRASSKQSNPGFDAFDYMSPITCEELEGTLQELPTQREPWSRGNFRFVRKLQDAVRNKGRVDLMQVPSNAGKKYVAVKQMPNTWMQAGPSEFKKASPISLERPWHDLAFVKLLNQRGFPHVCNLIAIFVDDTNSYVVSQFASQGDLFDWSSGNIGPKPDASHAREAVIKPFVIQILGAVRWIHTLGISHRDLSLENILLHEDDEGATVKLVDFGMSTLKRWCCNEVCGKPSYQAPEMHEPQAYDAFLVDVFALGVSVFAMALQDYPWSSSKKQKCRLFEYFRAFGFMKFLEGRRLQNGTRMKDLISPPLVELLEGLLSVKYQDRFMLGEHCWAEEEPSRRSVWDMPWLHEHDDSCLM